MSIKSLAILTSGGDAPGMNAAVRAITRAAIAKQIKVFGIKRGFSGLRNDDMFEMNLRTVSDIIHRGGTILYSCRDPKFETSEGFQRAVDNFKKTKIDCLVVIGGNGSLNGVCGLVNAGINCMFIPGTIDNDVTCSDYSIGFDTAINTAMEMVDKIRDTAQSHEKCNVVEVMGRKCGDIAVHTGLSVGATAILVPEVKYNFKYDVIERIKFTQGIGKKHFIVIVAEGAGKTVEIAKQIEKETGISARSTILSYVQRGGSPTVQDRVVASQMGCQAVDLLSSGAKNKAITMQNNKITNFDIKRDTSKIKKEFDFDLYNKALEISI